MAEYDGLIFIARCQPFHNGHLTIIREASKRAKHVLIILGSATTAPNIRNPFTYFQRAEMVRASLYKNGITNFSIDKQADIPYNDAKWVSELNGVVNKHYDLVTENVGLIGHAKDSTSFYLKLFPNFGCIDVKGVNHDDGKLLNATDIRNIYFIPGMEKASPLRQDVYQFISGLAPKSVCDYLMEFADTPKFKELLDEANHVAKYKKQWESAPYPPIFVTTDAVVYQSGHVLLVTRGAQPGKGMLALPGGFLNQYEKIEDGTLRELYEETKIDVPYAVMKNKAVVRREFDDPHRSTRGRTITFATLFNIDSELDRRIRPIGKPLGLTKVKGSDDAVKAGWYKLSDLKKEMVYEDHYDIIQEMIESLP